MCVILSQYAVESVIRLKGFDPKASMLMLKPREVSGSADTNPCSLGRDECEVSGRRNAEN